MDADRQERRLRHIVRDTAVACGIICAALLAFWACTRWQNQQTSVCSVPTSTALSQTAGLGMVLEDSDSGLYVLAVTERGLAADAGVQPGDRLLRVNATDLDTVNDLDGYLARRPAGEKLTLTLRRAGEQKTVVLLDAQP